MCSVLFHLQVVRLSSLQRANSTDFNALNSCNERAFSELSLFSLVYMYILFISTDVPRPLTNDLWVFLFQTIDAECVK